MKTRISVDWITASKTGLSTPQNTAEARVMARNIVADALGVDVSTIDSAQPQRFYTYSFIEPKTLIKVSMSELSSQGVVMVISGQSLSRVSSSIGLLTNIIEDGWKVTRLDVAWDLIGADIPAAELIDEQLRETAKSSSRKIASYQHAMNYTGFTVGSRKSEYFMRVYDKGLEQDVVANWLRCELEIKGDAAHPFACSYSARGGVEAVYKMIAMLGARDTYVTDTMSQTLTDESPYSEIKIDRGERDTNGWLYKQVYPALVKFARESPQAFGLYIDAVKLSAKID